MSPLPRTCRPPMRHLSWRTLSWKPLSRRRLMLALMLSSLPWPLAERAGTAPVTRWIWAIRGSSPR